MKKPLGVDILVLSSSGKYRSNEFRNFGSPVQGMPDVPLVPRMKARNIISIKKNEYKAIRQKRGKNR